MIVAIEGIVEEREPTYIHLNTAGVVREINVSLHTSAAIANEKIRLHITQIIREDADLLYGFIDKKEKRIFDTLLKISGVGPKVALAVCSTFTPEKFAEVISAKDVQMLKKVPGIGPKAAGRILVELADFIIDSGEGSAAGPVAGMEEARMALENLGFKSDAIRKALEGESGDTATLVKAALKKLQRL